MNKTETAIRHEPMRIAGRKVEADDVVEVRYPYTDAVIGTVPAGNAEHAREAFEVAANYKPGFTRYERQQILFRAAELIREKREWLAHWLTLELGICHSHALYETGRSNDVFTLAGQMAILDDGQIFSCDLTPHGKARKIYTKREPVRAISAITPFNHPLNMVAHKIAPAIATNNCVVCKPTELTPLTAIALADILYEAGLPPEMFQVVTGWPQDIGEEMIVNENIDIITFTGGVPVGKMIAEKAGYKRTALELGGNDPLIVLNDLKTAESGEGRDHRGRRGDGELGPAMHRGQAHPGAGERCRRIRADGAGTREGDPLRRSAGSGDPAWLRDPGASRGIVRETGLHGRRPGRPGALRSRPQGGAVAPHRGRPRAPRERAGDGGDLRSHRPDRAGAGR